MRPRRERARRRSKWLDELPLTIRCPEVTARRPLTRWLPAPPRLPGTGATEEHPAVPAVRFERVAGCGGSGLRQGPVAAAATDGRGPRTDGRSGPATASGATGPGTRRSQVCDATTRSRSSRSESLQRQRPRRSAARRWDRPGSSGRGARSRDTAARRVAVSRLCDSSREAHGVLDIGPRPSDAFRDASGMGPRPRRTSPRSGPSGLRRRAVRSPGQTAASPVRGFGQELSPAQCVPQLYPGVAGPCPRRSGSRRRSCPCRRPRCR